MRPRLIACCHCMLSDHARCLFCCCQFGCKSKTLGGQRFLVKSEDNVHVLATDDNIKLLAESEELYMDGTFKSSPRLFHQVYTIHVFKHGKQFPLVYCLLPGKSQIIYAKLFAILSDAMDDLMVQPQFQRVTSDFELAIFCLSWCMFGFFSRNLVFPFSGWYGHSHPKFSSLCPQLISLN